MILLLILGLLIIDSNCTSIILSKRNYHLISYQYSPSMESSITSMVVVSNNTGDNTTDMKKTDNRVNNTIAEVNNHSVSNNKKAVNNSNGSKNESGVSINGGRINDSVKNNESSNNSVISKNNSSVKTNSSNNNQLN